MAHPSPSHAFGAGPSLSQGERGFGENASRLCGISCRLLGWKPGEFWDATPAEVTAMLVDESAAPPDAGTIQALRRKFPDG